MAGRVSIKSDATKTTILDAYALGGTLKIAADVAGISVNTLDRWRLEDPAFNAALDVARSRKALEYLKRLDEAEHCDAKQMRWFLGTHFPAEYSQSRRVEVTGAGGGPVVVDNIAELALQDTKTGDALNGLLIALGAAAGAPRKNVPSVPHVGTVARLNDAVDSVPPSRPHRSRAAKGRGGED